MLGRRGSKVKGVKMWEANWRERRRGGCFKLSLKGEVLKATSKGHVSRAMIKN